MQDENPRRISFARGASLLFMTPGAGQVKASASCRVLDDSDLQGERSQPSAPERQKPDAPILHRLERDQAERVIGEVSGEVGEENESRPESQTPDSRR